MLKVENLNKFYKKTQALFDVSFELNENEIIGLIGLNGEGKTTIIKSICNIIYPDDSSRIEINSKSYKDDSSREDLFYLPEKFQISNFLTGRDFLKISMDSYKNIDSYNIEDEIKLYCEKLNFPFEKLNNKIKTYSKGMCQKIALISAFITKRKILILDEPMSGLDPLARICFLDALKYFRSNNSSSILLSTHILNDVENICDKIIILHKGKVIFFGTIKDFMKKSDKKTLEESFVDVISK